MSADTLPDALLMIFAGFTIGAQTAVRRQALVLAGEVLAKGLLFVTAVPT